MSQKRHLFILSMNNSGSTLLSRLLATARNVIPLADCKEGQILIQESHNHSNAMPLPFNWCTGIWTEEREVFEETSNYDWDSIKEIWYKSWLADKKYSDKQDAIFLEKSPPDILRAKMLEEQFENSYFIVLVRNPYAVCAGMNRKLGLELDRCARHWIRCSQIQIENIKSLKRVIWFTYEDMCDNQITVYEKLRDFLPDLESVDFSREDFELSSVLGKKPRRIMNMNQVQTGSFNYGHYHYINCTLMKNIEVLDYFGYSLLKPNFEKQPLS